MLLEPFFCFFFQYRHTLERSDLDATFIAPVIKRARPAIRKELLFENLAHDFGMTEKLDQGYSPGCATMSARTGFCSI